MPKKTFDAEAFRQFEYFGWDRLHSGYHQQWAHLTTQIVPALLMLGFEMDLARVMVVSILG
ncbi:MAG: hypothetical protein HC807_07640, partial [Gammaproteobacteria bacterium]|nr:hypothetical protein [Gammaproteobacteria bacterium]